jgi:hypothetical protein
VHKALRSLHPGAGKSCPAPTQAIHAENHRRQTCRPFKKVQVVQSGKVTRPCKGHRCNIITILIFCALHEHHH